MANEHSPAFSFYAKDFMFGTVAMSLAERGAYITLLAYQWDHGTVPTKPAILGRVLGCTAAQATKLWAGIGGKFKCGADGLWRNQRLELERVKQAERRAALTANGRLGGRPKNLTETKRLSESKANGNQNESLPSSSSFPEENKEDLDHSNEAVFQKAEAIENRRRRAFR
jgi:uncharacterized protein YdaU (DUF1376 family)